MEHDDKQVAEGGQDASSATSWDNRVFAALRTRGHGQPWESLVKWFSIMGNWGLFWVGLTAVIWLGGAEYGRAMFIVTVFFVYPTLLVNYIVKVIVGRDRPLSDDPRLKPLVRPPSSKSFPSSHAAMSFAAAAAMTYYYPALAPVFYLLALAMSWTRVYLGVHYPTDVLAGMGVGIACSFFWVIGLESWVLA